MEFKRFLFCLFCSFQIRCESDLCCVWFMDQDRSMETRALPGDGSGSCFSPVGRGCRQRASEVSRFRARVSMSRLEKPSDCICWLGLIVGICAWFCFGVKAWIQLQQNEKKDKIKWTRKSTPRGVAHLSRELVCHSCSCSSRNSKQRLHKEEMKCFVEMLKKRSFIRSVWI